MPYDLSTLSPRTPVEGAERIRLNDYRVCELLDEYVLAALNWVEARDLLVRKITVSEKSVRAYTPEVPEGYVGFMPEYIEIPLPAGLYEKILDLSAGPHHPFVPETPPEEFQLFLGRLRRVLFPEGEPGEVKLFKSVENAVLNIRDMLAVRRWMPYYDASTRREDLTIGLQGVVYEEEKADPKEIRSTKIWVSKHVPEGHVWTCNVTPGPAWADARVKDHDLQVLDSAGLRPHVTVSPKG